MEARIEGRGNGKPSCFHAVREFYVHVHVQYVLYVHLILSASRKDGVFVHTFGMHA